MKKIKAQYGFPLFVKDSSTDYLLKADKIRVSDIWALWHYIIKSEKRRYPGRTNYPFLLSVLEQAQYFYEQPQSPQSNLGHCYITIRFLISQKLELF